MKKRKNKLKVSKSLSIDEYSRFPGVHTFSINGAVVCVDMPLDEALDYLKENIREFYEPK